MVMMVGGLLWSMADIWPKRSTRLRVHFRPFPAADLQFGRRRDSRRSSFRSPGPLSAENRLFGTNDSGGIG